MASLLGRILRGILLLVAFWAVIPGSGAMAAPFAALVMDARSGEVLYAKNADTRLHPASLTKMMTLYIVFQEIEAGRLHLDDKVTVSKHAASQPPSRLGLKPGQKIAVRYLIRAAAVKSANDAATALGEHVSGSESAFAKRMTKTAKAIGMKSSTFRNANGLTAEGHLSTARDMTILGRHLFYDFPQYYNIFSRRTADAGIAKVTNTNSRFLDSYEGADGIKTGYTVAAGFNLTASAQRGNKRIIATVLGGTSTAARNSKMAELMDIGFGAARNNVREKIPEAAPLPEDALVAEAPAPIDEPDVEGGAAKTIRVSVEMSRSPRPKARPVVEEVPDAVAVAIAEGVEGALGEALAPPAPEGTLEAQVEKLAAGEPAVEEAPVAAEGEADAEALAIAAAVAEGIEAPVAEDGTGEAVAVVAEAAPEGTLEAQAQALAEGAVPAETPAPLEPAAEDSALAALRPQPRPETQAPAPEAAVAAAEPVVEPVAEEAAPVLEEVALAEVAAPATDAAVELALDQAAEAAPEAIAEVSEVETVAAAAILPEPVAAPARKAPIFDSPAPATEVALAEVASVEEVVVVKSTSGDQHWGVNVGDFASHGEAERALLKTALAESATLNQGLRKITQKGGSYYASFLGLSEEQADLACRRLRARGVACETLGPG